MNKIKYFLIVLLCLANFNSRAQDYDATKLSKKSVDAYERGLVKLRDGDIIGGIPLLKQAIEIAKKSTMLTTHPIPKNDLTNIYGANTSKIVEGNELAVMDDDEFNSVKAKMIVAGGQKSEKTCESLRNVYVTADVNEATSMGLAGKRVGLKFKVGVRPSKNLCGWGSCSNGGRTTLPH